MEILAVLDDLLFSSKITGSLAPFGHSVVIKTAPAAALEEIRSWKPALVIVDLGLNTGDPYDLIKGIASAGGPPVLAYTHHMDTAGQEKARESGALKVVSRSQFISEMPYLVGEITQK